MPSNERDFHNFGLEDNVYQLADGLIPDLADALGVDLDVTPNMDALFELVGKLGANKVLRENTEVQAISNQSMADFLDRSGVQQHLSRSLWTPNITPEQVGVHVAILSGGVANWQDRAARAMPAWFRGAVFLPTGVRPMNSPTEVTNANVLRLEESFGRLPTEAEYAARIIMPKVIRGNGNLVDALPTTYHTTKGAEIAEQFFVDNPALAYEKLLFVRVANAGVQLAVEMRKAARKVNKEFDMDPANPQVFIHTDEFPIARTEAQAANPRKYQKPQTGLRQVAETAKYILEAQLENRSYKAWIS